MAHMKGLSTSPGGNGSYKVGQKAKGPSMGPSGLKMSVNRPPAYSMNSQKYGTSPSKKK